MVHCDTNLRDVTRCPVVIECWCRSFTTMRSIPLAASTLAEDLEDDLEFKQERLKHADGRSTDLQGIPMILRVHRPSSWIWPTVLRLLDMIRSGLDHASFATCAHCGAPDIVVAADDDAGAPAKDDERAPGAFAVASATAADPAWIASADGLAEQVRWANAVATSLIEGERGFLGALRYLTGGPGRILSFRRLRDQLQEAVAETDVLLAVARRIDPDSPGRNQAAIPCTCPSLATIRAVNRAVRAVGQAIATPYKPGTADVNRTTRSGAADRQIKRLGGAGAGNYFGVRSALDWTRREVDAEDVTRCEECGAPDVFKV